MDALFPKAKAGAFPQDAEQLDQALADAAASAGSPGQVWEDVFDCQVLAPSPEQATGGEGGPERRVGGHGLQESAEGTAAAGRRRMRSCWGRLLRCRWDWKRKRHRPGRRWGDDSEGMGRGQPDGSGVSDGWDF